MRAFLAALLIISGLPVFAFAGATEVSKDGVATLVSITRFVRVQEEEGGPVKAGEPGQKLPEGAVVRTLEKSFCELKFSKGHYVRVSPGSRIKISQVGKRERRSRILLNLIGGRIRALINRALSDDVDFGVYGATTITAVKGTDYDMIRKANGEESVLVNQGRVNVASLDGLDPEQVDMIFKMAILGNIGLALREGNMITLIPGTPFPSPVPIPPGMPSPWTGKKQPIPGMPGGNKKPGQPGIPGMPGLGFP